MKVEWNFDKKKESMKRKKDIQYFAEIK